jgi:hypothetical protein
MRNAADADSVLVVIGNDERLVLETVGTGASQGGSILPEVDAKP